MDCSAGLTDAHLHLQDVAFAESLDAVLRRARDAGVVRFACNGTSESDWNRVSEIAQQYAGVIPCYGLHPWHVAARSPHWEDELARRLAAHPSGVGEIGLDRWISPRDEATQEAVFRRQWHLAVERQVPVMVHCLRAWDWLLRVLNDLPPSPSGMLIHAFGGSVELISSLTPRGAYFSFAGNVFEPKREKARQALRAVPPDRLLLETDAPDLLPPAPFRPFALTALEGKIHNEPANLAAILAGVARCRGESESALSNQLAENADRLFGFTRRGRIQM